MKWIYYTTKPWDEDGMQRAQQVYFRAVKTDEEGELLGGPIIELMVFAMGFYFRLDENPMANSEKYQRIYHEELAVKEYFLEEFPAKEPNSDFLHLGILYLQAPAFNKSMLLQWMETCLHNWGYPHEEWEEGDLKFFPETNALLSLFSEKNAKALEGKLGKEWWKKPATE